MRPIPQQLTMQRQALQAGSAASRRHCIEWLDSTEPHTLLMVFTEDTSKLCLGEEWADFMCNIEVIM